MKFHILMILIATLPFNAYSLFTNNTQTFNDYKIISDSMLLETAIDKGVVQENSSAEYMQEQMKEGNTIIVWILFKESKKIVIIDILRNKYKEDENAIIRNPSAYYVNEINGVIYNSMLGDKHFSENKKELNFIFKSIAVQEGDFDIEGKSKVAILKDYVGNEKFEWYKKEFPDKFKCLVNMDKEEE